MEKAPRTTTELRTFLLGQMVNIANGKQDPSTAKAICNISQQIYNMSALEIRYAAAVEKFNGAGALPIVFTEEVSDGSKRKRIR